MLSQANRTMGLMSRRFRLYPTAAQDSVLIRHCADARFVWNLALEQANCWRRGRPSTPGNAERMRQLAEARDGSWLGEGSSVVQQAALRDFDRAMRNWWAGTHRRPRWRKQGQHEGFVIRDVKVRALNRRWVEVLVPKGGWLRVRLSRPLPARLSSARVTLDRAGRWHVSFTDVPARVAGPGTGTVVGVDRGIALSFACSDGTVIQTGGLGLAGTARLARRQRRLARQKKGSNRSKATKSSMARAKASETDRRRDTIEKATTDLARRFDVVRIEDLRVRNMVRSARGSMKEPGRNVRAKAGLNRAIQQQGWGIFARRLGDKIGDRLVLVPAAYTSQRCAACGHVAPDNRESQAFFRCVACGHEAHADFNAAINIAAGRAVAGRGGTGAVGPPAEASIDRVVA